MRTFKLVYNHLGITGGCYKGKSPRQAAKKALRQLITKNKDYNGEQIEFSIKEKSRASQRKRYDYFGIRQHSNNNYPVRLGNIQVDFKYRYNVTSDKRGLIR